MTLDSCRPGLGWRLEEPSRAGGGTGMADDPRQPSDDPRQAGAPRTKGPTRAYENDRIRVLWDVSRCIHVGSCLRALPSVLDVRARPWRSAARFQTFNSGASD